MIVKDYQICHYREVFLITEWKEGCVYRAKRTGKYIHAQEESLLDKKKYLATSPSTSVRGPIDLNVVTVSNGELQ